MREIKDDIRNKNGLTEKEFLKQYNSNKYEKPSVSVDTLIFTVDEKTTNNYRKLPEKELKILMIKRGDHPYMGKWAIPGGFVRINENLEQAANRELYEETGVDNVYLEQLYTWGDVDRDPRMRVISTSYMALVDKKSLKIKAGDDAEDAKWFSVEAKILSEEKKNCENGYFYTKHIQLILRYEDITLKAEIIETKKYKNKKSEVNYEIISSNDIAFDHAKIIVFALTRLKNKVEYTDIAFNLMPEVFTLTELQKVYSMLLGKELLAAQFRRKINHMVIETEESTKGGGQRPAKLFTFNPYWNE